MTDRQVRFRRAASSDLGAAVAWYDNQAEGLSADFLTEVEHVIGRIAANLQQFPIVHRQIRRALLRQFPYAVYFVIEPSTITVLAVVHQRREPRVWRGRK